MHAAVEHLSSLIRVWPDGLGYGDPYEWAVAVRWISRTEVELVLQQKQITPGIWRAVAATCLKLGIQRVLAVTYPDGPDAPPRHKWIDLNKANTTLLSGSNPGISKE